MTTKESKLKVGARVSIWGDDDPQGKGVIIGGPDKVGNWKVRWDVEWDGEREGWEALVEECVE